MSFVDNADNKIINKTKETNDTDIFFQTHIFDNKNKDNNNIVNNIESNNDNNMPVNVISGTLTEEKEVSETDISNILDNINKANKSIFEKSEKENSEIEQKNIEEINKEIEKRQALILEKKAKKEAEERKKQNEDLLEDNNIINDDETSTDIVENTVETSDISAESNALIDDNISTNNDKDNIVKNDNDLLEDKASDKDEKILENKDIVLEKTKEVKENKTFSQIKNRLLDIKNIKKDKNNKIDNNNNNFEIKSDINWHEKATHDELTGLKNKTAFEEDIKEFSKNICILFADVNNLKYANDTIGHYAGDTLIIETGKVLNKYFPNVVYRLGGDEFIIVTEENEESIKKKIKNVNKKLDNITKADKTGIIYSVAIGYSYGDGIKSIEDIKNEADSNMYEIKQSYKKEHPELNIRGEKEENKDWKALALIDTNTKLYNKLALSYEKIKKTTIVHLIKIVDFQNIKREKSEEQIQLLSDIIRNIIKDTSKAFYIDNGQFIIIDNKEIITEILNKANMLSILTEQSSITGLENIDEILDILNSKLEGDNKKEEKELSYDDKLTINQRKMKEEIRNNHSLIDEEDINQILIQIQRKSQDIEYVLIASKDFNTLFIFTDVYDFLKCVYEVQEDIDFSYVYAAHSKGAVYYGVDEYDKEITDLFQKIYEGLKRGHDTTKDIQRIEGINIFENIFVN